MKVSSVFCINVLFIVLFSSVSWAESQLSNESELAKKIDEINMLSYKDLPKALQVTEALIEEYEPSVPFEITVRLIVLYKLDNQLEKAKAIIDETLLAPISETEKLRLKALQLEFAHRLPEYKKEQKAFYQEIEDKVLGIESVLLKSNMYAGLALFNYYIQEFAISETFMTKAIEYYPNSNYVLADHYQILAINQAQQQKLHDSLQSFIKADEIYQKLDIVDFKILLNVGGLLLYMKQWDKAIDYFLRALKVVQKPNFKIHNNLGHAYFNLERYDEAETQFLESIKVSEQQNLSKISALSNLGSIYEKREEYEKANQIYFQLIEQLISEEKWGVLIGVYSKVGNTLDLLGRNIEANQYYQKAIDLIAETDQGPLISRVDAYSGIINNLEGLREFEQAYFKLKEFKAFNDERIENSNKAKAEELQAKWELANKERELLEIEKDQQLKQQKIEALEAEQNYQKQTRFYMFIILILLGVAIITLFVLLTFRNKAHKKLSSQNEEISQQKNALSTLNNQLKKQSLEDTLTGLKNRRYLDDYMDTESKKIARNPELYHASKMLVILLDIDFFKKVNDTFGHGFGDEVLQFVGQAMKSCARESDFLVRWGGEEFVWVCTTAKFEEGPELCARLQGFLSKKRLPFPEGEEVLSASFGFATYPVSSNNFDFKESLTLADNALYEAKEKGRNGWVGYQINGEMAVNTLNQENINQLLEAGTITKSSQD